MELETGVDTLGMMFQGEIETDKLVSRGFTEIQRTAPDGSRQYKWVHDKLPARLVVLPGYLRTEVSLPKLRGEGSNVIPVDFGRVLDEARYLEEMISDAVGQEIPLLQEGRPYRIDYAYDFKGVGNKQQYIQAFGNLLNLPRGKKAIYGENETAFSWTKGLGIRLYDKELEQQGNVTAMDRMRLEISLRGVDGITRSIVGRGIQHRESVIKLFKKKMRLPDLTSPTLAKQIVSVMVKRGFNPADKVVRIMGHELILTQLATRYKAEKAQRLYFAFMYANRFGWDALRKYYSNRTYYRVKKEIKELGIVENQSLSYLDEELVVDFSKIFNLLDSVA
ncbi:MAG: hypothetical protein ACOY4I_05305 [Bacillota bacterium]